MPEQLTQEDLLDAIDRAVPESYLAPMKATGDGYELPLAFAKVGERCSLAVKRFENDGYILSAAGGRKASVEAIFYRPTAGAGAGKVLAGTLVSCSSGGQLFRTIEDAVFGGSDLEATATAEATGHGYEWNIKGKYTAPNGDTAPGELDTIELPLLDPVYFDPSIEVRNDDDADGLGRPDTLAAIGSERELPRKPNELDADYAVRIRQLPDTITPAAILRQLDLYLRPFGVWWRSIETWCHAYQECYDAPDTAGTQADPLDLPFDPNLFCYDDPRDPSPMQNRWLGENDYLGAFVVEVDMPAAIEDFGFCYDDPALDESDWQTPLGIRAASAYDVPDSLAPPLLCPCYDGIDFGVDQFFADLYALLDEIKMGGVFVTIHIKEP